MMSDWRMRIKRWWFQGNCVLSWLATAYGGGVRSYKISTQWDSMQMDLESPGGGIRRG
jgi:hypothetical protein